MNTQPPSRHMVLPPHEWPVTQQCSGAQFPAQRTTFPGEKNKRRKNHDDPMCTSHATRSCLRYIAYAVEIMRDKKLMGSNVVGNMKQPRRDVVDFHGPTTISRGVSVEVIFLQFGSSYAGRTIFYRWPYPLTIESTDVAGEGPSATDVTTSLTACCRSHSSYSSFQGFSN